MTTAQLPVAGLRVALFATCFNDTMWPETPKAVVRLLERLGCRVEFPAAQTCCGQMLTNTGYAGDALPLVRRFVDVFGSYDAVVAPSGSCVGSVRHQHATVARDAGDTGLAAEVEQVSTRVHELSELLVDVLGVTDVGAYFPHRVTYHPTCHSLRMLRVGDRPLRLLRAVEGIDLIELPGAEECCGFGGTFAVKNPDVSVAMGVDKADRVTGTGAEVLVAGDNSCLAHIGGILGRRRAGIRTMHLPPAGPAQVAAGSVEVFAENIADYRAEVVRAPSDDVPEAVCAVLSGLGLRSVVVPSGLDPAWVAALEAGFDVVPEDAAGSATDLDGVDAVVTGAAVGIATTGTVVLDHGPDQGRRALTLVPDTHVCVVREDQVVDDVPDAVRILGGEAHRGRPLTWVSGPSATSDIELQRVEGVHGPRTLVVVLVPVG
ncbi:Fe-S osidoreductase [Knoellia flava TL1]|uniref:(Fe-S)-binding protein n=2 Tax=Knoellia flava TaxID=913969 RepID=A0A8H9FUI2_9MICO|nr:Fe-S osidoreductase [Knoellia flava TL1]GGB87796.1 hypothetical protein GCM10011314_29510 [Knoellia flava]